MWWEFRSSRHGMCAQKVCQARSNPENRLVGDDHMAGLSLYFWASASARMLLGAYRTTLREPIFMQNGLCRTWRISREAACPSQGEELSASQRPRGSSPSSVNCPFTPYSIVTSCEKPVIAWMLCIFPAQAHLSNFWTSFGLPLDKVLRALS